MKAKSINKLLHGVVDNLCASISDPAVCDILKSQAFIAGGCIPTMLMDGFVNDFDFYFTSKEAADRVLAYYTKQSTALIKDKKAKYRVKLITENAINLSDKVQLITKYYGAPADVVDKFDWKHIKSYYTYQDGLCLNKDVYQLCMEQELIYTGSDYPLSSLLRLKKYLKNGWTVSNTTITHIALDFAEDMIRRKARFNRASKAACVTEDTEYTNDEPDLIGVSQTTMMDVQEDTDEQFAVEDILYHLNGLDPLTIQKELVKYYGKRLTVSEIVGILGL